jgi:hypothetical protein
MMMHSAVLIKAEVKALQAAKEQKKRREAQEAVAQNRISDYYHT